MLSKQPCVNLWESGKNIIITECNVIKWNVLLVKFRVHAHKVRKCLSQGSTATALIYSLHSALSIRLKSTSQPVHVALHRKRSKTHLLLERNEFNAQHTVFIRLSYRKLVSFGKARSCRRDISPHCINEQTVRMGVFKMCCITIRRKSFKSFLQ